MFCKEAKYFVAGLKHLGLFQDARAVRFLTQSGTPAKGSETGQPRPLAFRQQRDRFTAQSGRCSCFKNLGGSASSKPAGPLLVPFLSGLQRVPTFPALDIRSSSTNSNVSALLFRGVTGHPLPLMESTMSHCCPPNCLSYAG